MKLKKTVALVVFTFSMILTAAAARAQNPPIGIIDFYGLRSVSEQRARAALEIREGGDVLKTVESHKAIIERLKSLDGVADASISLVCCADADGKYILFVGVREKNSPGLDFRPPPNGSLRLPENILKAGRDYERALSEAVAAGDAAEDTSQGHALQKNPKTRAAQERFIELANRDLNLLRRVLRESADREHRALAAQIIAYAKNKSAALEDLIYGMNDADGKTRNNSMRALSILAEFAAANPTAGVKVPVGEFVRMLNSVEWTDRNKSAAVIYNLTAQADGEILARLKNAAGAAGAVDSLAEMARWKNPGHARPSFFILGRSAGFKEKDIERLWQAEARESAVRKILANMEETKNTSAGEQSARDEIIRLVKARAAALVENDAAFFEKLIAADFSYISSDGAVSDREAYLKRLTSGEMRFQQQNVSDIRVWLKGATAVVTCVLDDKFTFRGTPYEARYRTVHVYTRGKNGWEWLVGQTTEAPK